MLHLSIAICHKILFILWVRTNVDEIDPWSWFHQHVYLLLLNAQIQKRQSGYQYLCSLAGSLHVKAVRKMLVTSTPRADFTNILLTAFTYEDPKSVKRTDDGLTLFFKQSNNSERIFQLSFPSSTSGKEVRMFCWFPRELEIRHFINSPFPVRASRFQGWHVTILKTDGN